MAPRKQLMALETELRDSGIVHTCPPGQHDGLGISACWRGRQCIRIWVIGANTALSAPGPRKARQTFGWKAFT
jgi:hypothetical protein